MDPELLRLGKLSEANSAVDKLVFAKGGALLQQGQRHVVHLALYHPKNHLAVSLLLIKQHFDVVANVLLEFGK